MSILSGSKMASSWSGPLGILAGMAVSVLFRGHLNARYAFIVTILSAAVLALIVFAVRQTIKNQQREQFEFEEKLHSRRRTNFPTHDI